VCGASPCVASRPFLAARVWNAFVTFFRNPLKVAEPFRGLERFIYIMQDADPKPAAIDATSLPDDLSACHALILEQARVIVEGQESREGLSQEVEELKAYVERLLHQLYGRRRERVTVDPKQGMLDFGDDPAAADALAEAAAAAEKVIQEYTVRREVRKERPQPRQEKFPAHFPRVEETIEPPAHQRECPEHGPKQPIGYDTVETLEFERPKIWVRVRKYVKYACASQPECGVAQAERPTGLVEGSRYGTSVAAEVIANKYAYHLPLYREQDLFAGSGWTPSRSTLMNLLAASEFVLKPLAEHFKQRLLGSGGVGCDDTRVTLIVPPIPPPVDPRSLEGGDRQRPAERDGADVGLPLVRAPDQRFRLHGELAPGRARGGARRLHGAVDGRLLFGLRGH
jgi:transposase